MFRSTILLSGLALLSTAAAQQVWHVTVGDAAGDTIYNPTHITGAAVGDTVVFEFNPKNHTVTRSSFATPCLHLDGGFDSGFFPVAPGTTSGFPTYNITVNDTGPIWAYCKQGEFTTASHCGKGMVFAVNPGADGTANSFANFQAAAIAEGAALASSTSSPSASSTIYTAAYGSATIPPPDSVVTVTQTVTVAQSTWTTTYASFPDSPAPTPASLTGNVIRVIVGGSSLTFDPPSVAALPRDTIVFEFHQKNHTATQSNFESPCVSNGGFDSGFNPVSANATEFPTYNLTINDTAPVWAFCRQDGHCGSGMVFAVNAENSSARNFDAFKALAIQLNGTGAATSTAAQPSSSQASGNSNGAMSPSIPGALLTLAAGMCLTFLM
ncbi:hypothetical protein BC834DRAFT_1430 [Gloeopeniophorella convolvens]|nr:hypothetical protein BC834DRAFT_1430 [Gloeopeniophorella convolvens]